MTSKNRFCWDVRPIPTAENVLSGANYRFTVLTDRLVRLEYSPSGVFEDRASQSVFFRDFPPVSFTVQRDGNLVILETGHLVLTYLENAPFHGETLNIRLKADPATTWHYGDPIADLGGTTKTLDGVDGACPLEHGVCSRNGFSVLEDSHTLVLEEDGWIGLREASTVDCYFFGYGFDYITAVQDLYRLTGNPPLLPAYALGNWWSRYHAYTQGEYCALVDRFQEEDIPFSVAVIDMDWHVTQIPDERKDEDPAFHNGWTGYSWNKDLFPDYKAFLAYLKEKNLHTSLNLHPAAGVCRHEDMYPEMAAACGVDPASGKRIPLDLLSQEHMEKYFQILHHPYEDNGVDFWWMDWQQGTDYWWIHEPNKPGEYKDPRERVDPLWMLNHLHVLDIARSGKRPMFFSRYSGPGSHRYCVGFSGDTIVTWDSLRFQPYFTATASNIGYCWWSHDIGGHMLGVRDDEMQARWLQLGVLSPIVRLHSNCSDFQRKEPWCYSPEAAQTMKHWLRLRHRFFPYLYTMNHRTHTQGLPLVQPMYYSHPKAPQAYEVPNEYWFGSELVAAPITQPNDPHSRMGASQVWLPEGDWFDFFTGLHYTGQDEIFHAHRSLSSLPLFAKAGAIVPMADYPKQENRLLNAQQMVLLVFPGADNQFSLYEDAGDGQAYKNGCCSRTGITLTWGSNAALTISPAQGDLTLIPALRTWQIGLRGWHRGTCVITTVEDAAAQSTQHYDPDTNTTWITVTAPVTSKITLCMESTPRLHDNSDVLCRCSQLLQQSQMEILVKEDWLRILQQDIPDKRARMAERCDRFPGVLDALMELAGLM